MLRVCWSQVERPQHFAFRAFVQAAELSALGTVRSYAAACTTDRYGPSATALHDAPTGLCVGAICVFLLLMEGGLHSEAMSVDIRHAL